MADHTTYGLVCSELSEDLSKTNLGELKLDSFKDNTVKIKIKAASLNFPDFPSCIHYQAIERRGK